MTSDESKEVSTQPAESEPPSGQCFRDHAVAGVILAVFSIWLCSGEHSLLHSGDYLDIFQPQFHVAFKSIANGTIPWWNPYLGLGRPMMTDIHLALWYPPTYLLMLGEQVGMPLLCWLHWMLLWSGMRRLAIHFEIDRNTAFILGIVVCFSGCFATRLFSGAIFYAFQECYTPWLLYLSMRLGADWNWRHVSALGGMTAAMFLCGNGNVFWVIECGIGLFLLFRSVLLMRQASRRQLLMPWGQWSTGLGIAGLVTAFAWVPYLDLIANGNRGGDSYVFSAIMSSNLRTLHSLFFGISEAPHINWEVNLFVGAFIGAAGLCGMIRAKTAAQRAITGVFLFGILFALGNSTPFHKLCYHILPGVDLFRIPSRMLLWPTIAIILMAGVWLSSIKKTSSPLPWYCVVAILVAPVWQTLLEGREFPGLPPVPSAGYITSILAGAGLVILWGARSLSNRGRITIVWAVVLLETIPFLSLSRSAIIPKVRGRIDPSVQFPINQQRPATVVPQRLAMPPNLLPPNAPMFHSHATINGNTPLFLGRPWNFLHAITGTKKHPFINHTLPPAISHLGAEDLPYVSVNLSYDPMSDFARPVQNPFPRVHFTSHTLAVPDSTAAMNAILNGVPITEQTIIEATQSDDPGATTQDVPARIVSYRLNEITVSITNTSAGYLVLNEAWFPGWTASVDDQVIETEPVNVWMRGVRIPAGSHEVVFRFAPRRWTLGLILSGIGVAAMVFGFRGSKPKATTQ